MKYILYLLVFVSTSLNAQNTKTKTKQKTNYKLASTIDPVCKMEMPKFLKDTVHLQKKIYGVCSTHCKTEIKKNPKKYIK